MAKRITAAAAAALLCAALLLAVLAPRARAVTFTAVNNELLELTADTQPEYVDGKLYVPGSVFANTSLGVVMASARQQIFLYKDGNSLTFSVADETTKAKLEERLSFAVTAARKVDDALYARLACQVAATESVLPTDPSLAATLLAAAGRMLDSCRSELRRCLFDLRSDALDARDFNAAIRTTLAPIVAGTDIRVRFDVRRAAFTESETHAILAIVRELVSNAIRHGQAKNILVAGEFHDGHLSFSVRDDGCGFEPGTQPGPSSGHFGLQGIRERIRSFGGTLVLESKSGGPTRAEVRLPVSQRQSE